MHAPQCPWQMLQSTCHKLAILHCSWWGLPVAQAWSGESAAISSASWTLACRAKAWAWHFSCQRLCSSSSWPMDRHHNTLAEYVGFEKNVHMVLSATVSEPIVESRLLASGDVGVSDGRQWWWSGTCGPHVTLHWESLSHWPGGLGGLYGMWFGFGHGSACWSFCRG